MSRVCRFVHFDVGVDVQVEVTFLLSVFMCVRLRDDIAKEVGFVETNLSHYTGNQWREFFRMLPSTAESLLKDIAPFLGDAENREHCGGK